MYLDKIELNDKKSVVFCVINTEFIKTIMRSTINNDDLQGLNVEYRIKMKISEVV